MSAGLKMTVGNLVEIMLAGIGQRGFEDLKYHLFETIYSVIREQPWPWNWNDTRISTLAPVISVETYTWNQLDFFAQASGLPSIDFLSTGRMVEIDNRPYRVVKVDSLLNQIWFDAPLHIAQVTPLLLTFYRGDLALPTNSTFNVDCNGYKVQSTTKHLWRQSGGNRNTVYAGSYPTEYEVADHRKIDPPIYPPMLDGGPAAGNIVDGTYVYFFTYYDTESRLESAPGPTFTHTYTGGPNRQDLKYNNPLGNLAEVNSYQLRLWRSRIGAAGERFPANLVGVKSPLDILSVVTDNNDDPRLIGLERYYDGHQTVINWHLWPDAIYSVDVHHINCYAGRPHPDDTVGIGRNNIVTELLPMGASMFAELANHDVAGQHSAIRKFRTHLAYLIRNTEDTNRDDPGIEDLDFIDGIPADEGLFDPTQSYRWHY